MIGLPASPTMWYTAKASWKKEPERDTVTGRSLLAWPVNEVSEESNHYSEENPFIVNLADPAPPVNTFGKKLLECLVDDMFDPKYIH